MGLRVAAISDLHVDFPENEAATASVAAALVEADPDVVIVAGDVSPNARLLRDALAGFSAAAPRALRLFVPGNHDVWCALGAEEGGAAASRAKYETAIPEVVRDAGFRALWADGPLAHAGVGFCGTMGWYDYGFRADVFADEPDDFFAKKRYGPLRWGDARRARFGEDDRAVARRLEQDLARDLGALAARKDVGAIVVVTHVLPYRDLVPYSRRGNAAWDYCCAFLGSPGLGRTIDEHGGGRVRLVVCGHIHVPTDRDLGGGKRAVIAPLGYPGKEWSGTPDAIARARLRVVDVG